jgi:hypothetical protein
MERALIVKGRITDPKRIDLDEPLDEVEGEVEVTVRSTRRQSIPTKESVFDFIKRLPGGNRTKEEIDRQIEEDRKGWDRE